MMNSEISSTLSPSHHSNLLFTIPSKSIIEKYKNVFGIDVSIFFSGINEIGVYKCTQTNYRFYYPLNIGGDGNFYKSLESFEWYYMPWKWEHSKALSVLNKNDNILEVGSGGLGFLEKIHSLGFEIAGLELNPLSLEKAAEKNLKVFDDPIQNHALKYPNYYDVVCSFQVLEHIADVHSFIEAQLDCLKKGGKIIVSVPNNNSFIRYSNGGILNLPPHHMGLWDSESLKSLTKIFNIELKKIYYEPLQKYHLDWYIDTVFTNRIKKIDTLFKIYNKLNVKNILKAIIGKFRKNINGHSILVIYEKK